LAELKKVKHSKIGRVHKKGASLEASRAKAGQFERALQSLERWAAEGSTTCETVNPD
jgi:hypothetical protein